MVLWLLSEIMRLEDVRDYFGAYADYVGYDGTEELRTYGLAVHVCDDCNVEVPVSASDPQAYGPVLCPECGNICDREP